MVQDSPYTSGELFHFVGRKSPTNDQANYEALVKILKQQCVSYWPHIPNWGLTQFRIKWDKNLLSEELVVPQVTCFADIRKDHLHVHTRKYGGFGLSFPRELLVSYGTRPVMYFPLFPNDKREIFGRGLVNHIEAHFKAFNELAINPELKHRDRYFGSAPKTKEESIHGMWDIFVKEFLAFIKPFDSSLDNNHSDNFYMEREWRKFGNLCFETSHVRTIVVANGYKEPLEAEFSVYQGRIFTVEELEQ
jgi:Putative abortive phage resistance protein AbiGi, antitoxin